MGALSASSTLSPGVPTTSPPSATLVTTTAGMASPTLPRHRLVAAGPLTSTTADRNAVPLAPAQPSSSQVLLKAAAPSQASLATLRGHTPTAQAAMSPVTSPIMLSGGVAASITKPAWLQAPALSPASTASVVANIPCPPGRPTASTVVPNLSRWCAAPHQPSLPGTPVTFVHVAAPSGHATPTLPRAPGR